MEVPALVAAAAASTPQVNRVRPRFRNLRLVWVPVAALAAGITTVYVVHVRQVVPATEVARVEKDSGSVRATPQAPPAPDAAAKGVGAAERPAQPKAKSFQPVEMVEVAPPPPGINAPVLTRDNALLAMQKKTDELKTASEGAVVQSQKETAQVADEMQAPTAKRAAPASADRAESQQVVCDVGRCAHDAGGGVSRAEIEWRFDQDRGITRRVHREADGIAERAGSGINSCCATLCAGSRQSRQPVFEHGRGSPLEQYWTAVDWARSCGAGASRPECK